LQAFDYISVSSLEQAITLLHQFGEHARPLSGGTDLIVQLRGGQRRANLLVDIKPLAELNQLTFDPLQGLTIGSAVPCTRLCNDPTLCQHYPGLLDAISLIGGVQINRATLVENLCSALPAPTAFPPDRGSSLLRSLVERQPPGGIRSSC
jgi:carbon-monoxide dehydrogenase medium subunit